MSSRDPPPPPDGSKWRVIEVEQGTDRAAAPESAANRGALTRLFDVVITVVLAFVLGSVTLAWVSFLCWGVWFFFLR